MTVYSGGHFLQCRDVTADFHLQPQRAAESGRRDKDGCLSVIRTHLKVPMFVHFLTRAATNNFFFLPWSNLQIVFLINWLKNVRKLLKVPILASCCPSWRPHMDFLVRPPLKHLRCSSFVVVLDVVYEFRFSIKLNYSCRDWEMARDRASEITCYPRYNCAIRQ